MHGFNFYAYNLGEDTEDPRAGNYHLKRFNFMRFNIRYDPSREFDFDFERSFNLEINAEITGTQAVDLNFSRSFNLDIGAEVTGTQAVDLNFARLLDIKISGLVEPPQPRDIDFKRELSIAIGNSIAVIQPFDIDFERSLSANIGSFIEAIQPQDQNFSRSLSANIRGSAGIQKAINFYRSFNGKMRMQAELKSLVSMQRFLYAMIKADITATQPVDLDFARSFNIELFTAPIVFNKAMNFSRSWNLAINSSVAAAKDMNITRELSANILGSQHVGKLASFERHLHANIERDIQIGKYIPFERDSRNAILGYVLIAMTRYSNSFIDVEIPPGGELRIDSNTGIFTVTLNGENIIYLHRGDWMFITRYTAQIIISSLNSAPLEGEVIYHDQWI